MDNNQLWLAVFQIALAKSGDREYASEFAHEITKGVGNLQGDSDEQIRQFANNQGGRSRASFLNRPIVTDPPRPYINPSSVNYQLTKKGGLECRTCGYFTGKKNFCNFLGIVDPPSAYCDAHTANQRGQDIPAVGYAIKGFTPDEKRITYGVVYPVYEVDLQGEWATPEVVEKAAHDWMENFRWFDTEHSWEQIPDETVVESFIAPCDIHAYFGKNLGDDHIREGDWVLARKWNQANWDKVKRGEITGYSLGGFKQISFANPPAEKVR